MEYGTELRKLQQKQPKSKNNKKHRYDSCSEIHLPISNGI